MSLIFKKETHQYFNDNQELYSVSKILDYYLYGENARGESLSPYQNIKKEILQPAIIKGNAVHKIGELFLKNIHKENISKKLKDKIVQNNFNENILASGFTLINYLSENFNTNMDIISEQMISYDFIAGTPDLLYKNKKQNLYTLGDFKTYKTMDKKQLSVCSLQLTAYSWLLLKLGYQMNSVAYIFHVKNDKVKKIPIQITKELLHEWNMAIKLFKENKIQGEL